MSIVRGPQPQFVVKDGEPVAVILSIEEYRSLLEKLDDADDIAYLKEIEGRKLEFRKLGDFLREADDS